MGLPAGHKVSTQVLVGGKWSTSQTRLTDSTGRVEIPVTYGAGKKGKVTYRAVTTHGPSVQTTRTVTLERV